jgi:hypothetical protein
MRFKLPKIFSKCVIVAIITFAVGFLLAQMFSSSPQSGPGVMTPQNAPLGGGQAQPVKLIEKREFPYSIIIGIVLLIAIFVAYGYYRENRRKS